MIGIDIGGTSIKAIVANQDGIVLDQTRVATDASQGKTHIVNKVDEAIHFLLADHPDVQAIGIGTAGRVNADTGQIVYATDNLPGWMGFHIKEWFEKAFQLPVAVDNDANTALLGEQWQGAGQGVSNIVMLTLGTGVGGANMIKDELVRGAHWNGGEWGHVVLIPDGHPCNCGLQGCIEQYLSGSALVRLASEESGQTYSTGQEVLKDYKLRVPAIMKVMAKFIHHLSLVLHNLHIGINPQTIVIGGGLIDAKQLWWDELLIKLHQMSPQIDVRPALLGNHAGAIGSAKLALQMMERRS
ncbi:ROK family protein [Paenibacillus albiflavus]|uniref:ROK family protein n=1 Tax=Paenibacillus albiflavus TaxID=2545760 RepID=UPI001F257CB6|nr:ROK family protein [Paenibacillus albiflavus]